MSDTPAPGPSRALRIGVVVVLVLAGAGLAVALAQKDGATGSTRSADSAAAASTSTTRRAASTTATTASTTTTAIPTTTTTTPTGRFVSDPGSGPVVGTGAVHTYTTEVEEGSGVDPKAFDAVVDSILADSRSWIGEGYAFQRVPSGGSFTITLATPATTDSICLPLDTAGKFSCHEGHRVVLNLQRWNEGTTDLPLSVADYRANVINHEVGHELGKGHVGCGGAGLKAPVMMQQSKGLDGCLANPWPTLDGT